MSDDDLLLDAVREEVLAYGVRRATATSIAQRAGVSRVTVHRRGGSIKQLILDALVTEFSRAMAEVAERVEQDEQPGNARESVVATSVALVDTLSRSPLVAALLEHDPDLLLPYLVDRLGRSQLLVLEGAAAAIQDGQQEGTIREGDPRLLAQILLHALTPFVIGSRVLNTDHEATAVHDEVRHLVDAYLAPAAQEAEAS